MYIEFNTIFCVNKLNNFLVNLNKIIFIRIFHLVFLSVICEPKLVDLFIYYTLYILFIDILMLRYKKILAHVPKCSTG